jgi:single-stranded DNA-specific DHH superfamily exonuclease
MLYFQYGGELSISSDIANELFYRFPDKVIVVAYIKGTKANISVRGNSNIKAAVLKSIEGLEGARGGGHKQAVGAQMSVEDLPKFKSSIEELLSHKNPGYM